MKTEFLTGLGLEQGVIDKIMAENGKDINGLKADNDKLQTKLDTTSADLTAQLTAANEAVAAATAEIESFKGMDIDGIKQAAADWEQKAAQFKADAEQAQRDAADKITAMEYDNAINGYVGTLKFTSEYAKKGFVEDFKAKGFKLEDGKFLGADDYVKIVQEKDPATFEAAEGTPKLKVSDKTPGLPGGTQEPKSLLDALSQKYKQ